MKSGLRNSFLVVCFLLFIVSANGQLTADAGNNYTICPGDSVVLGGATPASGGIMPYTYHWAPATGLSSTTVAHPIAFPSVLTTYTLTVTDDTNAVSTDAVSVALKYINKVNAGNDINICQDGFTTLGSNYNITGQGVTYSWAPAGSLNYDTVPRPIATPLQTTTYTLTATMPGCDVKVDYITVSIINIAISAGNDTTIAEGQTIELHATGGFFYYWSPSPSLTNAYAPNPDVEPVVTTTYYVWAETFTHQCGRGDSVTVNVIKGDQVYFYNTFTPNGDDINDTWYIGNIWKYPNNTLQVFNRNGQLVFRQEGYANTWDGRAFGQDLPAATYFYIMDLGNDRGDTYHGTVTIVK